MLNGRAIDSNTQTCTHTNSERERDTHNVMDYEKEIVMDIFNTRTRVHILNKSLLWDDDRMIQTSISVISMIHDIYTAYTSEYKQHNLFVQMTVNGLF